MGRAAVALLVVLLGGCACNPQTREVVVPCVKKRPVRAESPVPPADADEAEKTKDLAIYAENADKYIAELETVVTGCLDTH